MSVVCRRPTTVSLPFSRFGNDEKRRPVRCESLESERALKTPQVFVHRGRPRLLCPFSPAPSQPLLWPRVLLLSQRHPCRCSLPRAPSFRPPRPVFRCRCCCCCCLYLGSPATSAQAVAFVLSSLRCLCYCCCCRLRRLYAAVSVVAAASSASALYTLHTQSIIMGIMYEYVEVPIKRRLYNELVLTLRTIPGGSLTKPSPVPGLAVSDSNFHA